MKKIIFVIIYLFFSGHLYSYDYEFEDFKKVFNDPFYSNISECSEILFDIECENGMIMVAPYSAVEYQAELGNKKYSLLLGKFHYGLDVYIPDGERDFREGLEWFKNASSLGSAQADYYLAAIYLIGWGVNPNHVKAINYLGSAIRKDTKTGIEKDKINKEFRKYKKFLKKMKVLLE